LAGIKRLCYYKKGRLKFGKCICDRMIRKSVSFGRSNARQQLSIWRMLTHHSSGSSMGNLAKTFHVLGRLHDALNLEEKAHEFLQRVLPPDDPQRGVFRHFSCTSS